MEELNSITDKIADNSIQLSKSTEALADLSSRLGELVNRFKI